MFIRLLTFFGAGCQLVRGDSVSSLMVRRFGDSEIATSTRGVLLKKLLLNFAIFTGKYLC